MHVYAVCLYDLVMDMSPKVSEFSSQTFIQGMSFMCTGTQKMKQIVIPVICYCKTLIKNLSFLLISLIWPMLYVTC